MPLAVGHDRRRRSRAGAFAALAGAFAIVLGLGITGWYVIGNQASCGGDEIVLEVAVAPELVGAINALAEDFDEEEHEVDGRCVTTEVRGEDPDNVTYGITNTGPTTGDTESDVWIPDSSLWVNLVQREASEAAINDTGTPVAHSPLILAQPGGAAEDNETEPIENLVPTDAPAAESGRDVRVIDPLRSASGLATLAMISSTIDDQAEDQPELTAALQALQRGAMPNEETAFDTLGAGDDPPPLMVLSEQAAWRYNTEHGGSAHVSYPKGGSHTLDYPYLIRGEDPVVSRAAEEFRAWVTSSESRAVVRKNGFRSPDGAADTDVLTPEAGFQEEAPENLPTPSDDTIAELTQSWNRMKLDTRLLTILDVSGSMAQPVPGTDMNRMEVTTKASGEGLTLFPETSKLGQWEFSTDLDGDTDHRELTPIRELGETVDGQTHREVMTENLESLEPSNGDTGLYNTILAAYREMSRTYEADRVNAILMLTDGQDDTDDGISKNELLSALEEESSKDKPIPVITIAFGPSIDPEPLEEIADATGGGAYTTEDPTEIGDIFLKAFSLRLQGQGEDAGQD
ncbi:VWA domain-containing protein [Halostreptopolyspora alba]|uniref:VWA domain-containing protein n=1 Tax=Halostreptopolyspora alba TaxID=2487137 RepID=A0A3N0E6T6_9ACTN|nr:VWA domain-containing protein [Nocardiopsaceae bacterium YIM 96095]